MSQPLPIPLPISEVVLPGGSQLDLKGFTLIVGPNSSGKTQLLRDIHAAVTGTARSLVVATKISFAAPRTFDELLSDAVTNGALDKRTDPSTRAVTGYRQRQHHMGLVGTGSQELQVQELTRQYDLLRQVVSAGPSPDLPTNPFLTFLSGAWCASLFLENRLTLLQDTQNFDYDNAAPTNLLQSLFLSRQAQEVVEKEVIATFDRSVWLDYTRANMLILRAADALEAPPGDLRRFPEEMRKHRPLSSEGDGLRSYAAVCMTLLLSKQPLCLLDEPELCLHPPQAYALGRFIGAHAQEQPRGLIVATHSSHVCAESLTAEAPQRSFA